MPQVDIDGANSKVSADTIRGQSGTTVTVPTGHVLTVTDAAGLTVNGSTVLAADNSVTLAKMAGGTDGNIISYDASGDPVAVATGSSGQVLTSAGAGAPPTFATAAAGGKIVQVVNVTDSAVATGTSRFYADDTIPQNTEGDEFMTLAITPASASNKLIIRSELNLASSGAQRYFVSALFQDTTANALTAVIGGHHDALTGSPDCVVSQHYMVAGTTSSTTFKVRGGTANTGTTTFNGAIGSRLYGGVYGSSLTIWEIEA